MENLIEFFTKNENIQRLIIDPIKNVPDFFLRPKFFFRSNFNKETYFKKAVLSSVIFLGIAAAIYSFLGLKSGVEESSLVFLAVGTIAIWIMYAIFLNFWVYLFKGRKGLMVTIATYIYIIGFMQPLFVILLWSISCVVKNPVSFRTISAGLGGSGAAVVIAEGNFFSEDVTGYFRLITGVLILIYFTIGIWQTQQIKLWQAISASVCSVIFFIIIFSIILLVDNLTGLGIITRLTMG